ncbi:MAG: hypothetical protein JNK60_11850, partial [Acidobacteria bacterium]|nr:hypothetical protein [Acidobacteriota bacterium]
MTGPNGAAHIGGLPRRFTKMTGAGNDFLVFDESVPVGPREAETIRRVCRRGTGVGADGILFVVPDADGTRIQLDYYNADGGPARFCANGTRCAARFARLRGLAGRELVGRDLVVVTGWGEIPATVREDGAVTLSLPSPVSCGPTVESFDRDEDLLEKSAVCLSVGVPHLVVF